ncbi:MAG: ABC transporter permease [Anaerolineales bacterium]
MDFSLQRFVALIRKETIQLLRDRRYVGLTLVLSFTQVFLYAYAANMTVIHLPMVVVDQSRDVQSRQLVQTLVNSQYFDLSMEVQSQEDALQAIGQGKAKVGVVIPPQFAVGLQQRTASVLVLLDGSDSFAVRSAYGAIGLVMQNYAAQWVAKTVIRSSTQTSALPIVASSQVLYNPGLVDVWFIIPGVIGLILQTLAVEQAALTIVKERELGTLEQILATPVRQLELTVSKMIPLLMLSFVVWGMAVVVGVLWFGVPFRGSLLLYLSLSLLFIIACLGLGLFIATRATTQLEAQSLSLVFFLFGILLSGFTYPRSGMPLVPLLIGNLVPLTYFAPISRSIFLKGVGLDFIWADALALVIYSLVVILIASKRFKMRLD